MSILLFHVIINRLIDQNKSFYWSVQLGLRFSTKAVIPSFLQFKFIRDFIEFEKKFNDDEH